MPTPAPTPTPVTPTQFRADFPEFANTITYPDSQITFWANVAVNLVNMCRWGALYTNAQELLIAHYVTVSQMNNLTSSVGGAPGEMTGPTASKATDKTSISFDTKSATLPNSGELALTTYGQTWMRLARLIGAGPLSASPNTGGNILTTGYPIYQI